MSQSAVKLSLVAIDFHPEHEVAAPDAARVIDVFPCEVGRSTSCGRVVYLASASRRHAKFEFAGGVLQVTDLGSSNGTYVNSHRVKSATLVNGDRVSIGGATYQVGDVSADVEEQVEAKILGYQPRRADVSMSLCGAGAAK